MHFDWTISAGTVLQVASMFVLTVVVFNALAARLSIFENTLKTHAEALGLHALRLDRADAKVLDLVADLQRLIGRWEVIFRERA